MHLRIRTIPPETDYRTPSTLRSFVSRRARLGCDDPEWVTNFYSYEAAL